MKFAFLLLPLLQLLSAQAFDSKLEIQVKNGNKQTWPPNNQWPVYIFDDDSFYNVIKKAKFKQTQVQIESHSSSFRGIIGAQLSIERVRIAVSPLDASFKDSPVYTTISTINSTVRSDSVDSLANSLFNELFKDGFKFEYLEFINIATTNSKDFIKVCAQLDGFSVIGDITSNKASIAINTNGFVESTLLNNKNTLVKFSGVQSVWAKDDILYLEAKGISTISGAFDIRIPGGNYEVKDGELSFAGGKAQTETGNSSIKSRLSSYKTAIIVVAALLTVGLAFLIIRGVRKE